MASRVDAMRGPRTSSSPPHPWRLLGRYLLVLAGTTAAGLASAFLYLASPTLMPVTLGLLSSATMGVIAGLASRWLFREQTRTLQVLGAFSAVAAAMAFIGWLTWGMAGVEVLRPEDELPDWSGLGLLALGWAASWLGLRAWSTPLTSDAPAPTPSTGHRPAQGSGQQPRPWRPMRRTVLRPRLRVPAALTRSPRPARLRRKGRHAITLSGQIEHRCPYCLELVQRRDPRGVVVCPECKTRHHADCWAVTGMCQVPHQHS